MLAAVPARETRALELFTLALSLVERRSTVSGELKEHFNRTLRQAKAILLDPTSVSGRLSPEAIRLALEIRAEQDISTAFEGVEDIESVTPPIAALVLKKMDHQLEVGR